MNSGPNQPSSGNPGNSGGRGRRRRRGRRAPDAPAHPPQPHGQQRSSQSRRHGQQQGKRQHRPAVNQKVPDAGIYSAPMDHNYRTLQGGNGNGRGGSGRVRSSEVEAVPGSTATNKPIYAFVDDLFFLAKIQETARKLNVKVDFVKNDKEVIESIVNAEQKPSLIIFDLNNLSAKPLTTIPKLKSKLKKETNIIGFLSHLQGDLKVKALEAGCDMVVPRSAFSQNLPQLLRRHATETEREAGV